MTTGQSFSAGARILTLPPGTRSPAHVLSKTTATLIVAKSALHANLRKTHKHEEEPTEDMELGTLAHELILGKGHGFEVAEYIAPPTADESLAALVEQFDADQGATLLPDAPPESTKQAKIKGGRKRKPPAPPEPPPMGPDGRPEWPDWRRKDAQSARDAIRARGLLPVLPRTLRAAKAGVARCRERMLDDFGIVLGGESEIAVEWSEYASDGDEVTCWGAIDHYKPGVIYDLKFVRSAHPKSCAAHIVAYGGDIQAAAYLRAFEQLAPDMAGRLSFVFLFCELGSGAVTPVPMSGSFLQLGNMRWRRAIETWARCRRTNRWPAYVTEPVALEAPEYAMAEEMSVWLNDSALASRAPAYYENEVPDGA